MRKKCPSGLKILDNGSGVVIKKHATTTPTELSDGEDDVINLQISKDKKELGMDVAGKMGPPEACNKTTC